MKRVLTVILLLFVAAGVGYLVVSETRSGSPAVGSSSAATEPGPAIQGEWESETQPSTLNAQSAPAVSAYYFHGTSRCSTCLKMEQFAKEAIEAAFPDHPGGHRIRWQALDYDEPGNEHFVKQYALVASSLILVSNRASTSGPWRKLDRTWDLVGDEVAFKKYVADEVRLMLGSDR